MWERHNILPTRARFFISSPEKTENVQKFKKKSSQVAISLQFSSSYFMKRFK